jgi:predicted nucleic acid-binding protein
MILLDTDHTTFLKYPDSERGRRMIDRLNLKTAATALVNHELLLSANRTDFERVPGLRVENWLD